MQSLAGLQNSVCTKQIFKECSEIGAGHGFHNQLVELSTNECSNQKVFTSSYNV